MINNMGKTADVLQPCLDRLSREAENFSRSRFSHLHNDLLKAFCNVVQAESSLDYFFKICVLVPAVLAELEGELYLLNKKTGKLHCVCTGSQGIIEPPRSAPEYIVPATQIYKAKGAIMYPLFPVPAIEHVERKENSRADKKKLSPFTHDLLHPDPFFAENSLLGIFVVSPLAALSRQDKLFFATLTNWIGYKLNNRLIAVQHLKHLRFLNSLALDIGHNVIVPNMYFKYLLRKLEKRIEQIDKIKQRAEGQRRDNSETAQCQLLFTECAAIENDLQSCHQELVKHHRQISLFLESLFREEHFSLGHLVVHPQKCLVEKDIIIPQLEMYADRLANQNITIDKPQNMTGQEFPLMVDIGLLSQVYANLFSNAVKYTREIEHDGRKRKAMAYGFKEVDNFPKPGRKGIKFNVFTTGPALNDQERTAIFQEGVRGENSEGIAGLGHGLAFIQRVVDVHDGQVGCEATEEGNNFYFILPLSELKMDNEHEKN